MGRSGAAGRQFLRPVSAAEPRRRGTCELCGGHGRELMILAMPGFIGWACGECRQEIHGSTLRRFCCAAEETDPGE